MKYHITQFFSLLYSYVLTICFFRKAKLIRFPIDIRNYNNISFGNGFITGRYNRIECYNVGNKKSKLNFGKNVQINDKCHISCIESIEIGDNVLIASNVFITDHDHGDLSRPIDFDIPWIKQKLKSSPVIIENNVWIGESVIILKGVRIGKNSVIAAGAIVTKDIPQFSVAVGSPARVIKKIVQK